MMIATKHGGRRDLMEPPPKPSGEAEAARRAEEPRSEGAATRPVEDATMLRSHMLFAEYIVAEIEAALMDSPKGLRARVISVRDLMEAHRRALADLLRARSTPPGV